MVRRDFLALLAVAPWLRGQGFDLAAFERRRVLDASARYLKEQPITITVARSDRSAGGLHDFFSEGDYWWPDPKDPNAPYLQRDGESNPGNFVEHRRYMMRLSVQMPALAAAWKITRDEKYAAHAVKHLRAWFVEPATRMNPHLLYAQAIKGRFTGRGIGIIDTIHLVEVARAASVLEASKSFSAADRSGVKAWFAEYLKWMSTHAYGIAERDATNNHGVCWVMQAAEFARLTGNAEMTAWCVDRFKTVLVPNHMAADGSFPRELTRTKPYGYSLFVLDAITAVAQILDLWSFTLPEGRGMARAVAYMYPYILDKKKWPKPPDVMYFDEWPMRHHFAGLALSKPEYLDLWKRLPADSAVDEVIRNFFIRQPVLWVK